MSMLSHHISSFLSRVTDLFGEKARCLTVCGYTRTVLRFLSEPFGWIVGGRAFSLSVPTDGDLAFCLDHMRAWLRLALAEVQAEFPDFEVAQAFDVFNIRGGTDATSAGEENFRDQTWSVSMAELSRPTGCQ